MSRILLRLVALAGCIVAAASSAAPLFETAELIAASNVAAPVPPALTFTVATAGDYTITLSDLQTPTPFGTLRAIVTRDLQVVNTVSVAYTAGVTPVPASATFTTTAGNYRVHVLGLPTGGTAGGSFGVRVAPAAGGAAVLEAADSISLSTLPPGNQGSLQADFSIADAGTYNLSVTDRQFPAPLTESKVVLLRQTTNVAEPPVLTAPGSFDAQPGTYTIIVLATADAALQAGLFTAQVSGGVSNRIAYRATRAIGQLSAPTEVTLTAGAHTLALKDLGFPASLTSVGAALVQQDGVLGQLTQTGETAVTANAGAAQLYTFGAAAAADDIGAYTVSVSRGAQRIAEFVRLVDNTRDPATPSIFSVTSPESVSAGNYRVVLKDFAFPAAFGSVRAAVVQGTSSLATMNSPNELTLALQAAPFKVLIAARPTSAASGLFGVSVNAQGVAANVLETTQGVGGLSKPMPITIPAAGRYDVTLADLQFPAALSTASLAVTQGTTMVGQVFGAGTLAGQQFSAGTYVLNFQGAAAANASHGSYGLRVIESAVAPTITLTATPTTVAPGQSVTLQWSSTSATTCAAANGWTGMKATSGSQTVGPITGTTTFELSCTGAGGSVSRSVDVAVVAAATGGGKKGGGGSFDALFLCVLSVLSLGALRKRSMPS